MEGRERGAEGRLEGGPGGREVGGVDEWMDAWMDSRFQGMERKDTWKACLGQCACNNMSAFCFFFSDWRENKGGRGKKAKK